MSATDQVRGRELWRIDLDTACAGDCSGDGAVSIAELISAVGIALGLQSPDECAAADIDADGAVSISELIAAVRAALDGSPERATRAWLASWRSRRYFAGVERCPVSVSICTR